MRTVVMMAALLLGACYGTHFESGSLECSARGECPDGYTCQANHCFTDDTPGKVGEACAAAAQCISGLCNGRWCTQSCSAASDCPAGSACAIARNDNGYCFPVCQSSAACRGFGADVTCVSGTDVAGGRISVCSVTN